MAQESAATRARPAAPIYERTSDRGRRPAHAASYRPDIDGLRAVAVVSVLLDIIFFDGTHFTPAGAKYIGDRVTRTGVFDF